MLSLGYEKPLRIVCLRETMKSIEDSVHTVMGDQTKRLGLQSHYRVMDQEIRGANGTEIFYAGLKTTSADTIKSMEGCDIFWVEEAQGVSKMSMETLLPTIRKPGAELWVSMNPRFEDDDSYQRWIVHPPPRAVVVKLSYRDNAYVTEEMLEKMRHLYATDPDEYEHVYEGGCKSSVMDAVYKVEMQRVDREGRITRVPYTPMLPVNTYWDLGYADMVSIWFAQPAPFEIRVIDYYQSNHKDVNHYFQILQNKEYVYGEHVLPWDGNITSLQTGKSMVQLRCRKGPEDQVRAEDAGVGRHQPGPPDLPDIVLRRREVQGRHHGLAAVPVGRAEQGRRHAEVTDSRYLFARLRCHADAGSRDQESAGAESPGCRWTPGSGFWEHGVGTMSLDILSGRATASWRIEAKDRDKAINPVMHQSWSIQLSTINRCQRESLA